MFLKGLNWALIVVAQLVGYCPTKQKVNGSISIQGTCLGCRSNPWPGHVATEQCFSLTLMFLSLFASLSLSIKINK